jgi:uncharacterized membrane protein
MTILEKDLDRRIPTPERALLLALVGVACFLRFWRLGEYSFDVDEIFSLNAASASWSGLLSIAARDVSHPPLFYMLLKAWLSIAPATEGWTRVLPALFGAAAIVPLYGICRAIRLGVAATALVLCLFAFSGVLVQYAQYLRMFSLLQLASVLSIWAFVRFLRDGTRHSFWGLTDANLLMVYSHYWGWTVIAAQLVILALLCRHRLLGYLASAAVVALLFAPWVAAVAMGAAHNGSATRQISWIGQADASSVLWLFGNLAGAPDFPRATVIGLLLFALPVLALVYVRWIARRGDREAVSPLCWMLLAAVPVMITLAAGYVTGQSIWGERHLIIVAAPYFLLVGAAVDGLPWRRIGIGIAAILMLWSAAAGIGAAREPDKRLQWQSLLEQIAAASSGPVVLHTLEPFVRDALAFYVARGGVDAVIIADDGTWPPLSSGGFWLVYRDTTWTRPESPERMLAAGGFRVERTLAIDAPSQRVVALSVRRVMDAPLP